MPIIVGLVFIIRNNPAGQPAIPDLEGKVVVTRMLVIVPVSYQYKVVLRWIGQLPGQITEDKKTADKQHGQYDAAYQHQVLLDPLPHFSR